MAFSEITVEGIGRVRIFRRRGLKNIRITINHDGTIRLSIPWYVPRAAGIRYILSKKDWIEKHRRPETPGWHDGQRLSEKYVLRLHTSDKKNSKTIKTEDGLHIYLPDGYDESRKNTAIKKSLIDFLKQESRRELVPLLEDLARKGGFKVKEIRFKKLKSRWGSCNHEGVITLNILLVHLPKELAGYVIVHELAHIRHLNHSKDFWNEVEALMPDYKQRRKALRKYNPAIIF